MITSKIRRKAPYAAMFTVIHKEVTVVDEKKKKKVVPVSIVSHNSQMDDKGHILVLPIDQFSGRPFCLNPQGFPMNDIMIYEQSQSVSVAESALRRIKILHPENVDQKLTPEEMFERIVPSNWSSPAEFVHASKAFANKFYARQKSKADAEVVVDEKSNDKIDFSENKE